jgi:hypothetical protein
MSRIIRKIATTNLAMVKPTLKLNMDINSYHMTSPAI